MTRAFAAAALLALASTAVAAMPVKTLQVASKTADYELTIKYPQTGIPTIDRELAAWAKQQSANFIKYVKEDRQDGAPWSLTINCTAARNDAQMLEFLCKSEMADDGNHTHFDFTSFNYMMPDAHRVFVAEVVTSGAYAKMRAYAAAHMVPEDSEFDAQVADAAALPPVAESFAAFAITPSAITVWFSPEQLGNMTSAGGHVTIALTELKGTIRTNWRAPVASFDCAKAATLVEKAVCSDVALARLDRDLASAYRLHLQGAANPAAAERVRKDQQTWLGVRSHACPVGDGMVDCLARTYRARIASLKRP